MIFCNCNKVFVLYQNITQDGHIILHEMMHVTLNVDVILCVVIDECNVDRCMFYCLYSDNIQILHILTIFYILQGYRYEAKHKAFALVFSIQNDGEVCIYLSAKYFPTYTIHTNVTVGAPQNTYVPWNKLFDLETFEEHSFKYVNKR